MPGAVCLQPSEALRQGSKPYSPPKPKGALEEGVQPSRSLGCQGAFAPTACQYYVSFFFWILRFLEEGGIQPCEAYAASLEEGHTALPKPKGWFLFKNPKAQGLLPPLPPQGCTPPRPSDEGRGVGRLAASTPGVTFSSKLFFNFSPPPKGGTKEAPGPQAYSLVPGFFSKTR